MAATPKVLFRGAATTNISTTLYTVPAATTTIASNIIVTNTDTVEHTFTMSFDGVLWANTVKIAAESVALFDMKQVLVATDTIQGGSDSTTVRFHISGVEIA